MVGLIKINKWNVLKSSTCQSFLDRFIVPLYMLILSLLSSSLILKPKNNFYAKYNKLIIFFLGFLIVIISQITFKFIAQ